MNGLHSNPTACVQIFARQNELAEIRYRLGARQPYLLHGPAGVGKTLLLQSVLGDFSDALYCAESKSPQAMFRALADALLAKRDPTLLRSLGRGGLSGKSSVALKGLVLDSLRVSSRSIILDRLRQPTQALAAAVRELISAGSVVVSAARSAHMEDAGFLLSLYPFKQEKLEIRNFDPKTATAFISHVAGQLAIHGENAREFLERVLEYSHGNPGMIVALCRKASQPRYRAGDHIKIAPLYIDFRLEWNANA